MIFFSSKGKHEKKAGAYIEMARKILNYRRDLLRTGPIEELENIVREASRFVSDKDANVAELEAAEPGWEAILRRHGGSIYPKTFWSENIETFLVAAIIVLGIRAFFFQPFIIPTNSMYPTYSGMYYEVYENGGPSLAAKPVRFVLFGARNYQVEAEGAGKVRIPLILDDDGNPHAAAYDMVDGRKWLFLPTTLRRYPIMAGERVSYFDVPAEFSADGVLLERFFPEAETWLDAVRSVGSSGFQIIDRRRAWIEVPQVEVRPGELLVSFDILSGDALFVDRFSYHFFPPSIDDPIVFRTGDIAGMMQNGQVDDKYYIKRLVAKGGDVVSIERPVLLLNGEPLLDGVAFLGNAEEIDGYPGYRALGLLANGAEYPVPENHYFALGDNSANSYDSRYWGSFHERAVVGRALWIYYPFTKRWGVAQ